MPFAWDTARYCLDHRGNVLHFPAGSYDRQVSTSMGRKQMDAMLFVFRARTAFATPLHLIKEGSFDQQLTYWALEYARQERT